MTQPDGMPIIGTSDYEAIYGPPRDLMPVGWHSTWVCDRCRAQHEMHWPPSIWCACCAQGPGPGDDLVWQPEGFIQR